MPVSHDSEDLAPDRSGTRTWTDAQSDAAFDLLGDRLIDATRRFLRSSRRQRIQTKLYTVEGRELGPAQIDALEVVADEGEVHMSQLAARLRLDPSTVTRTINPLVNMRLLERFTDPANRRYVVLRCTRAGADAVKRVVEETRSVMRETLDPMEPDRRLLLVELLDEYITLLEAHHGAGDDTTQNDRRGATPRRGGTHDDLEETLGAGHE